MVKVACFQATALDAHVVVVVGPECLCSILYYLTILLRMNGELRRSLICRIRPTSSLFYGRDPSQGTESQWIEALLFLPISSIFYLSYLVGKTQPESILLLPSFPLGEKEISSGEHEQKTSSLPLLSLFVFFLGKGVKKKR